MAGAIGINRYRVYREYKGYPGSKYKGLSLSFWFKNVNFIYHISFLINNYIDLLNELS